MRHFVVVLKLAGDAQELASHRPGVSVSIKSSLAFIFTFLRFIYLAVSGLSCSAQTFYLGLAGSVVVACGFRGPMACGILVLWPGIEPASPELQGGVLATGPPGKSLLSFLKIYICILFYLFMYLWLCWVFVAFL